MDSGSGKNRSGLLIVEDDKPVRKLLQQALAKPGREILLAETAGEARAQFERAPGVVILDIALPDGSGMDLLQEFLAKDPSCMILMITGRAEEQLVVGAMQSGAMDYITKPFSLNVVRAQVEKAFALAQRNHVVRDEPAAEGAADASLPPSGRYLIGRSEAMVELFKQIGRLVSSDIPVLITGESGSGKELVARSMHRHGANASGPFVPVDCGSVPAGLLEAELFGYERGAFTGAVAAKPGRFELAHGGTLFLDEVANIPVELQANLLRAMQERSSQRLGSTRTIKWEARIISATNADIREMTARGRFREDLLYRLAGVELRVPALRDHIEDLPLLVEHFLGKWRGKKKQISVTEEAFDLMRGYRWPGNVRELEHVVDRAAALASGPVIGPEDLPQELRTPFGPGDPGLGQEQAGELSPLDEMKRRHARMVLNACGGNKTEAARVLKIDRKTLNSLLEDR